MIQNNNIREEFVKQNGLSPLIKHVEKTINNALSLEIIYALVFTSTGMDELKKEEYKDFIDRIKQMRLSDTERVRQAAEGIIWKLEQEDNFNEILKQRKNNSALPMVSNYPVGIFRAYAAPIMVQDTHHIMISYCWANKPFCRQIYERLQSDNYKVWIDENEMYGSIIERMAEAIENSEIILMCMSSDYKKSLNCQAEAEYAYRRKKKIVPLILESNYKADGWLGLIAGNKLYINFADKMDHEFEEVYNNLVTELKRNGLELIESVDNNQTQFQLETNENFESVPKKTNMVGVKSLTKDYHRIERTADWNEHHAVQFFIDNNLNGLLPILQGIDGLGLNELHRVYERSPESLYKMFNKDGEIVSLGLFFKFIGAFKKYRAVNDQTVFF